MGAIGAVTYIGSYFVDEFGTSTGRVGLLLAVSGGSYTVGSVIGGTSLFDFRVKGTTLGLGLLSGGAMWAVFGLDSGPVVAVGAIVISLLVAGILNIMFVTVLSYESNAGAATTMAMQASVTNLGSALGVAIGGLMLGIRGYDALGLFAGLSFVMAGIDVARQPHLAVVSAARWRAGTGRANCGEFCTPPSRRGRAAVTGVGARLARETGYLGTGPAIVGLMR
ncbi:MAG: hypothetical protein R2849_00730 [Thermomicrobiales bacterium]